MRTGFACLFVALLAGCTSAPTVTTDVSDKANFSQYKTYRWLQAPAGAAPLTQQRIVELVDAQLHQQGWSESANADVVVAANVATQQRQTLDTFYNGGGFAGWGWGGMGMSSTQVETYEVGTLVVDLFDARSQQAVWRGTANGTVASSPDKNTQNLQNGIARMFAGFPHGTADK